MSQRIWRVLDVLNWSRDELGRLGVQKPRLDAEILLAASLGLTRLQLYTNFDRPLEPVELDRYRALLQRRRRREPVAYVLGTKEFYGLDFEVGPTVLVPRPETELLVERALARLEGLRAASVADVGTGSGCVAVALGHARPDLRLVASDISEDALAVARANASRHGVTATFLQGALFEPYPADASFDVVVTNPPYIPSGRLTELAPELSFEPRLAIDGGDDGLDVVRPLLAQVSGRLRPGGWLLLELDATHGPAARDLATGAGLVDAAIERDLAGRDRLLVARRPEAA